MIELVLMIFFFACWLGLTRREPTELDKYHVRPIPEFNQKPRGK
jgi:hypothetical protein